MAHPTYGCRRVPKRTLGATPQVLKAGGLAIMRKPPRHVTTCYSASRLQPLLSCQLKELSRRAGPALCYDVKCRAPARELPGELLTCHLGWYRAERLCRTPWPIDFNGSGVFVTRLPGGWMLLASSQDVCAITLPELHRGAAKGSSTCPNRASFCADHAQWEADGWARVEDRVDR